MQILIVIMLILRNKGDMMLASQIIKNKLKSCGGSVDIIQLNGHKTTIYFVTENTFWSNGLYKLIDDGYNFSLFDILESESFRFNHRIIPKGNARKYKLGEEHCNMDTAVGILGYKYYLKQTGDSIYEPMHVISAILEWADIAYNKRGYILFR
jgi:hypothetical protein